MENPALRRFCSAARWVRVGLNCSHTLSSVQPMLGPSMPVSPIRVSPRLRHDRSGRELFWRIYGRSHLIPKIEANSGVEFKDHCSSGLYCHQRSDVRAHKSYSKTAHRQARRDLLIQAIASFTPIMKGVNTHGNLSDYISSMRLRCNGLIDS